MEDLRYSTNAKSTVPNSKRELARAVDQAAADLAYAFDLCPLAKQHDDKMLPGRLALGVAFGSITVNELMKPSTVEHRNQPSEQACIAYHEDILLCRVRLDGPALTTIPR